MTPRTAACRDAQHHAGALPRRVVACRMVLFVGAAAGVDDAEDDQEGANERPQPAFRG